MKTITEQQFNQSIVAQHDDEDYQESGYVAVVFEGEAAIGHYSHCSCYGTWDALTNEAGTPPTWDWEGSPDEMVALARRRGCTMFPDRAAVKEDYDYDHMMALYDQIIEWADARAAATEGK